MITRLLSVTDFRAFQNWRIEPHVPDFRRVNVIYGANGSGKSTLASMLATASEDVEGGVGLKLRIHNGASEETVSTHDHALWANLRVFNRDYVAANLRFDNEGQSTAIPLLTLGQKRIDREDQLKAIEEELASIVKMTPDLRKDRTKAGKLRDELSRRTALEVVGELSVLGGRYAARSYTARQLRELIEQGSLQSVDPSKIQAHLKLINSPRQAPIRIPSRLTIDLSELQNEIEKLVSTTATAKVIEVLRDNHDKASWVQSGLEIHEPGDDCLFCGGTLSPKRVDELNAHFDDSVKRLQAHLKQMKQRLGEVRIALDSMLGDLPASQSLSPDLVDEYDAQRQQATADSNAVKERIAALEACLHEKEARLFSPEKLPDELAGNQRLSLESIRDLFTEHNKLIDTHNERIMTAAREVEETRVSGIQKTYLAYDQEYTSKGTELERLDRRERELVGLRAGLQQEELDANPLAEALTEDLARLLGRDELEFRLAGKDAYQILRNGQPALFLSEGEKTAISLLYFLKSLEVHGGNRSDFIVVIDDPVSSLDSNVVAGASSHIWSKLVGVTKAKQLFLLTHNFDLFRMWSNNLDRLSGPAKSVEDVTYSIRELRMRIVPGPNGRPERRPYFVSWPEDRESRNRLRSEYHYLFWRVASALEECAESPTLEKELEIAAILPNVCRKMLEGFLSFRFPEKIGDFRGQMVAAIESLDEGVTRTRVVSFLNQYSHNEEGDLAKGVPRPESINVLKAVFELIRHVDKEHYNKMCSALSVAPIAEES